MLKEVRSSIGYFFEDIDNGKVLMWHHCANKPMCFLINRFNFGADYAKVCHNCGHEISRWENLYDYITHRAREKFLCPTTVPQYRRR